MWRGIPFAGESQLRRFLFLPDLVYASLKEGEAMSAEFEQVFLDALEDLREGRAEPIERYLELVQKSERAQLADLLAMYFASRRGPASREVNSKSYERVLAAIDRLNEPQGEAGI